MYHSRWVLREQLSINRLICWYIILHDCFRRILACTAEVVPNLGQDILSDELHAGLQVRYEMSRNL